MQCLIRMEYSKGSEDLVKWNIPQFAVTIHVDLNKYESQKVFFTKEQSSLAKAWGATPSLDWVAWLNQFEIQPPDSIQDNGSYKYPEANLRWFNEKNAIDAFNKLAKTLEVLDRTFFHYPQIYTP